MRPTRTLYIAGAGGLGRETAVLVERINDASTGPNPPWHIGGFVDDDPALQGRTVLGHPVTGPIDTLPQKPDATYTIAIGAPSARRRIRMQLPAARLARALIDPSVFVHASVTTDAGTMLYRGVVIMTGVQLGTGVIVDANATVGHDVTVGTDTIIHPGATISGDVTLGDAVRLGAGSVVLPGVSIGERATVGAGAVVTRDLPPGCTAVGVPARPINE